MSKLAKQTRVVLCTCPPSEASKIAKTLLEKKLVACVNVVPGVKSLYWWKDQLNEDAESLLVMKTKATCYSELESKLQEIHPYDVPEVLSFDVDKGSDTYISWVHDTVQC